MEHLHEINKCRGLFATHYHELTNLTSTLNSLSCHTMQVKEWKGDVVFLHEVSAGAADRSYGIHVGRLAGLPLSVIDRSRVVLSTLEQENRNNAITQLANDLPLFAANCEQTASSTPSKLEEELARISPDELSPREALDLLYTLKNLAKDP